MCRARKLFDGVLISSVEIANLTRASPPVAMVTRNGWEATMPPAGQMADG